MLSYDEHDKAVSKALKDAGLSRLIAFRDKSGKTLSLCWQTNFGPVWIPYPLKLYYAYTHKPAVARRYLRAVHNYVKNRWVEGHNSYKLPVDEVKTNFVRVCLRKGYSPREGLARLAA